MTIGDLVDSSIMQIFPIETAKNIGNTFTIIIPQKISPNKNEVKEIEEVEEEIYNCVKSGQSPQGLQGSLVKIVLVGLSVKSE